MPHSRPNECGVAKLFRSSATVYVLVALIQLGPATPISHTPPSLKVADPSVLQNNRCMQQQVMSTAVASLLPHNCSLRDTLQRCGLSHLQLKPFHRQQVSCCEAEQRQQQPAVRALARDGIQPDYARLAYVCMHTPIPFCHSVDV